MYAVAHGYSFWTPPLGPYRDKFGRRCPLDSFLCFLRPLSRCETLTTLEGLRPEECPEMEGRGEADGVEAAPRGGGTGGTRPSRRRGDLSPLQRCVPRIIAENRTLKTFSISHMKTDDRGYPLNVPPPWREKGLFWYVSHLLGHLLLRPNAGFIRVIHGHKKAIGWDTAPRPMLSLHVRRGDSCNPDQARRGWGISAQRGETCIAQGRK